MSKFAIGCFAVLLIAGLMFGLVGIMYWLWGAIAVTVFGLPSLTYWQMWGLWWLLDLLLPGTGVIGATTNAFKN